MVDGKKILTEHKENALRDVFIVLFLFCKISILMIVLGKGEHGISAGGNHLKNFQPPSLPPLKYLFKGGVFEKNSSSQKWKGGIKNLLF